MRNITALLIILLLPNLLFAQSDSTKRDFTKVDVYALSVKNITDLKILSNKLTANYPDTTDKVRAIYRWVTDNISYDVANFKNNDLYKPLEPKNETDATKAQNDLQLAVAKYVARERKAVCYGYANLFKTLCDYAGIETVVIDGYGRSDFNPIGQPFKSNHSWNAVKLNGRWLFVDATWGAGSVNYNITAFKKVFNDGYFLSAPQDFIRDHYPLDTKWAFLNPPPTLEQFFGSPIIFPSFIMDKLHLITPLTGIIEAKEGDKIQIEISTNDAEPYFGVIDDTQAKQKTIQQDALKSYTYPDPNNKKIIACEYEVKSKKIHDLFVVYNYESIIRYEVKVK